MEVAHDTAFQERPETVNCLRVNSTVYILPSAMPHVAISGVIVSCDQADFFRYRFADEAVKSFRVSIIDDAGHDIAFALNGTKAVSFPSAPVPGVRLSQCRFLFLPPT